MVEETVKGIIEIDMLLSPEIPSERIPTILPGWKAIKQTDNFISLNTEDYQKFMTLFKDKTIVACVSEQGKNSQNLIELKDAILKISKFTEKGNETKSRLKDTQVIGQLIYKTMPIEVKDPEVADALETFRRRTTRLKRMIIEVDDLVYGLHKTSKSPFTVSYTAKIDKFPERYNGIPDKFVFSESNKPIDRKVTYIS